MKKNRIFLALAAMFAACPSPTGDNGGDSPVTITGSTAYYYDPGTTNEQEKGVFVEGRTVTLSPFWIAEHETTYELWYEVYQ
jgi:hypothetical protein